MLELIGVTKLYERAGIAVRALDDVSLSLADGAYAAVVGRSG